MSYRIEPIADEPGFFWIYNPKGIPYKVGNGRCTCPAFQYRGHNCKHMEMIEPHIVGPRRWPRSTIRRMADSLGSAFDGFEWLLVGSFRRGLDTCKDIDIVLLATPEEWGLIIETIRQNPGVKIESCGNEQCRGEIYSVPFDISRCPDQCEWWYYILYRTGSKETNIIMRRIAKAKGLLLNEHGLHEVSGDFIGEVVSASAKNPTSEADIFHALDLEYLTPEER